MYAIVEEAMQCFMVLLSKNVHNSTSLAIYYHHVEGVYTVSYSFYYELQLLHGIASGCTFNSVQHSNYRVIVHPCISSPAIHSVVRVK